VKLLVHFSLTVERIVPYLGSSLVNEHRSPERLLVGPSSKNIRNISRVAGISVQAMAGDARVECHSGSLATAMRGNSRSVSSMMVAKNLDMSSRRLNIVETHPSARNIVVEMVDSIEKLAGIGLNLLIRRLRDVLISVAGIAKHKGIVNSLLIGDDNLAFNLRRIVDLRMSLKRVSKHRFHDSVDVVIRGKLKLAILKVEDEIGNVGKSSHRLDQIIIFKIGRNRPSEYIGDRTARCQNERSRRRHTRKSGCRSREDSLDRERWRSKILLNGGCEKERRVSGLSLFIVGEGFGEIFWTGRGWQKYCAGLALSLQRVILTPLPLKISLL